MENEYWKKWYFITGAIGVLLILIGVAAVIYFRTRPVSQYTEPEDIDLEEPPAIVKNIGINFDYYNPSTNRAGDLLFTDRELDFPLVFEEFGNMVPAEQSPTGKAYPNPQPGFRVPRGTKIRALIDGVVADVPKLPSGDYSVIVSPQPGSRWRYETEHVDNPIVKPGDTVTAGQVVAEASAYMMRGNPDWAGYEIGVLKGNIKQGVSPRHLCPFLYLEPSVKSEITDKLKSLFTAWEKYRNNSNEYDEESMPVPGCLTLDPIDA